MDREGDGARVAGAVRRGNGGGGPYHAGRSWRYTGPAGHISCSSCTAPRAPPAGELPPRFAWIFPAAEAARAISGGRVRWRRLSRQRECSVSSSSAVQSLRVFHFFPSELAVPFLPESN